MTLPTAPLRNWNTVDNLLQRWDINKASYFSASKYSFPIQFGFDIDQNGNWIPLIEESPMVTGNTNHRILKLITDQTGLFILKGFQIFLKRKFFIIKPYRISYQKLKLWM